MSPSARQERSWPNDELAGVRVLVVDDNPAARELMEMLLAGCGAAVDVTAGAREGFDAFLRERPAIIVSDIDMPGEDGRWLVRRIRALPPEAGGNTPVVAVTAASVPTDTSGFQAWLPKPHAPPEIYRRLCEVLKAA